MSTVIRKPPPPFQAQRGVTLIISLIMLIAMTLAGLAMVRQSGTGVIIARNLTFKRAATVAADRGVEAARAWLRSPGAGGLTTGNITQGFFPAWCNVTLNSSNQPDFDNNGIVDNCGVSPPPSTFSAAGFNWSNGVLVTNDDGSGNEIRYVIHRMCQIPGSLNVSNQQCVTVGSAASGGSKGGVSAGNFALSNTIQPYFRITTRVVGPMNTVVYTQAIVY